MVQASPDSPTGFSVDTTEGGSGVKVGYSKAYANNWEAIFGKKDEPSEEPKPSSKSHLN